MLSVPADFKDYIKTAEDISFWICLDDKDWSRLPHPGQTEEKQSYCQLAALLSAASDQSAVISLLVET